jgi:hypothetical protein
MYAIVTKRFSCGCSLLDQVNAGQHSQVIFLCDGHVLEAELHVSTFPLFVGEQALFDVEGNQFGHLTDAGPLRLTT